MDTMLQVVRQENIEAMFSRKLIDAKIRLEMAVSAEVQAKIEEGVSLLTTWLEGQYYDSKMERLEQLKGMDPTTLVTDIYVGVSYFQTPTLFTSATAQLAGRLGFSDKRAAILTVAELLAVLCWADAFDVDKLDTMASLTVQSRLPLSDTLLEYINNSMYLPPMVCEPLELTSNYDSGYLSHKDSVILGAGNHHDGDVCLDVLNIINKIEYQLDFEFLCQCDEMPKNEFTLERVHDAQAKKGRIISDAEAQEILADQIMGWEGFKARSQQIYLLLHSNGNRFYLTNKYDKRGRIYAQGYHVSTQGASFKKAAIELAHEELIEGVPT